MNTLFSLICVFQVYFKSFLHTCKFIYMKQISRRHWPDVMVYNFPFLILMEDGLRLKSVAEGFEFRRHVGTKTKHFMNVLAACLDAICKYQIIRKDKSLGFDLI